MRFLAAFIEGLRDSVYTPCPTRSFDASDQQRPRAMSATVSSLFLELIVVQNHDRNRSLCFHLSVFYIYNINFMTFAENIKTPPNWCIGNISASHLIPQEVRGCAGFDSPVRKNHPLNMDTVYFKVFVEDFRAVNIFALARGRKWEGRPH